MCVDGKESFFRRRPMCVFPDDRSCSRSAIPTTQIRNGVRFSPDYPFTPQFVTDNDRRETTASVGGFDWPAPAAGTERVSREQRAFEQRARCWPLSISAAYTRFADFYKKAVIGESYGQIGRSQRYNM